MGVNILITGTTGCGKSVTAKEVCEKTGLNWINVSEMAVKENLVDSYDDALECHVIDEDKVVDHLEPIIRKGGNVVEYHGSGFFPEDWFDAVYVLKSETSNLYDRLVARGYSGRKLNENMECEIFQVLLEEARDTFDASIIHELQSNTESDLNSNVDLIVEKINSLANKS